MRGKTAANDKAGLTVEQHVDSFLGEWMQTIELLSDAVANKNFSHMKDIHILQGLPGWNVINSAGNAQLSMAAVGLLRREKLSAKLSVATARRALVDGLADHLPKAKKSRIVSEHAVIARAAEKLKTCKRDDGIYLFPIVFAHLAKTTDFRIGAARIVSKSVIEKELEGPLASFETAGNDWTAKLTDDWKEQSAKFDHYIAVEISGFEEKMAWPAARDAAETLLNLIRMYFGFAVMDDVRIGDGFIWQSRRSALRLDLDGGLHLSSSFGGSGSHLKDGWAEPFDRSLKGFSVLLSTSVSYHIYNDGVPNPTFERITYFNRLISETYCEPHHPIRIVRLISALEALAVIGAHDKSHTLAHHCGCAGAWGDGGQYCEIYDAVREAYHWRKSVVHGDAPSIDHVMKSFIGLERHLLTIYLGLLGLHAIILNNAKPKSMRDLRNEFGRRIDMFFWNPSIMS